MVNYGYKGMHILSNNTQIIDGVQEITDLYKQAQVHWFMLLGPNSDPTICIHEQKSRFIRPGYVFPVI